MYYTFIYNNNEMSHVTNERCSILQVLVPRLLLMLPWFDFSYEGKNTFTKMTMMGTRSEHEIKSIYCGEVTDK